jgi:hypothetical protein
MVLAVASLLLQIATPSSRALPSAALAAAAMSADTRVVSETSASSARSGGSSAGPVLHGDKASAEGNAGGSLGAASLETKTQTAQSLSTIRVPDPLPAKPRPVIGVAEKSSLRNWLILSVAQHGAAAFDAYATRQAVSKGAHEADPLMRPFAGSPGIYVAIQAGPVALDYLARRMQRSQNSFLRRTWWVPQSASTGLFVLAGVHNLRVAGRQ